VSLLEPGRGVPGRLVSLGLISSAMVCFVVVQDIDDMLSQMEKCYKFRKRKLAEWKRKLNVREGFPRDLPLSTPSKSEPWIRQKVAV